ncbi:hypothetical protein ACH4E9_19365 [Streptomyces anulatus]
MTKAEDAIIDTDVFLAGETRHLTEKKSLTCGFCHPEERDTGRRRPFADEGQKHLRDALTTSLTCRKRGFLSG